MHFLGQINTYFVNIKVRVWGWGQGTNFFFLSVPLFLSNDSACIASINPQKIYLIRHTFVTKHYNRNLLCFMVVCFIASTFLNLNFLLTSHPCVITLAPFPSLPTVQFLIASSKAIKNWTVGRPGNEANSRST